MGAGSITVSRTEYEAGKQRVVERVRSGGVTLDECESDKVLAGEVEVRREGKVRWGARWKKNPQKTVSRTDFDCLRRSNGGLGRESGQERVTVNKCASDRV